MPYLLTLASWCCQTFVEGSVMFLKSRIIDHFFLQIVHCELGPPRGGKSGYIFLVQVSNCHSFVHCKTE